MFEQGRSTLPTGEDGRILDRLAGLEKVISPALVRQVLHDTNRVNGRACELTHEVMIWVVLAMGLLTHLPIRQVFRHARTHGTRQEVSRSIQLVRGTATLGRRASSGPSCRRRQTIGHARHAWRVLPTLAIDGIRRRGDGRSRQRNQRPIRAFIGQSRRSRFFRRSAK